MPIIPLFRMPARQIQMSAFIRGSFIFCFLGLVVVPCLMCAEDWYSHDHMAMRLKELEDKNPEVRYSAAIYLGLVGQESKDDERKEVISALKRHLYDTDKFVRYSAAGALAGIDTSVKEVLPILIEKLKDKDTKPDTAALALRHFGPEAKEAVPIIIDLMKKEGIDYSWGTPISHYGDVLRDIGTPEALAAIEPLKRRELIANAFYAPFDLLLQPVFALLTSLCFAGLFWRSRAQYKKGKKIKYMPLLIPALSWGCWGLYEAYEHYEHMDSFGGTVFIVCWFLFFATLAGVIPWLASRLRGRAQEKCKPAGSAPS
ncbi:MAG: HEAT repeat domain-containing protein [Elusimicrobia bacterium]|nr:HEAT repeat domain-containing protein [Elusimicrobiota bacterium]